MHKYRQFMSDRGFTLIEIIASIAILAIVIGSLVPFFPQVMAWTDVTEDELVSSNLVTNVSNNLQDEALNSEILSYIDSNSILDCRNGYTSIPSIYLEGFSSNTFTDDGPELTLALDVCDEDNLKLYRTKINIVNSKNRSISEAFTYMSIDGGA
ncbi:prepilin-type N-terminal cleavage/methylation domain-containing protein [Oceanobacillus massiliensis]|uniref:prepilin-type N-terminal cleavage/methylation domain-containing protein n=1 Tax=Oceanobacillus massiliensis TaxID=1465765 RepID=UPI0002888B3D|nr:prepilin-type N-terminal cleavage/methylation domain-containing protein [Oceanobacillus massiliensis]